MRPLQQIQNARVYSISALSRGTIKADDYGLMGESDALKYVSMPCTSHVFQSSTALLCICVCSVMGTNGFVQINEYIRQHYRAWLNEVHASEASFATSSVDFLRRLSVAAGSDADAFSFVATIATATKTVVVRIGGYDVIVVDDFIENASVLPNSCRSDEAERDRFRSFIRSGPITVVENNIMCDRRVHPSRYIGMNVPPLFIEPHVTFHSPSAHIIMLHTNASYDGSEYDWHKWDRLNVAGVGDPSPIAIATFDLFAHASKSVPLHMVYAKKVGHFFRSPILMKDYVDRDARTIHMPCTTPIVLESSMRIKLDLHLNTAFMTTISYIMKTQLENKAVFHMDLFKILNEGEIYSVTAQKDSRVFLSQCPLAFVHPELHPPSFNAALTLTDDIIRMQNTYIALCMLCVAYVGIPPHFVVPVTYESTLLTAICRIIGSALANTAISVNQLYEQCRILPLPPFPILEKATTFSPRAYNLTVLNTAQCAAAIRMSIVSYALLRRSARHLPWPLRLSAVFNDHLDDVDDVRRLAFMWKEWSGAKTEMQIDRSMIVVAPPSVESPAEEEARRIIRSLRNHETYTASLQPAVADTCFARPKPALHREWELLRVQSVPVRASMPTHIHNDTYVNHFISGIDSDSLRRMIKMCVKSISAHDLYKLYSQKGVPLRNKRHALWLEVEKIMGIVTPSSYLSFSRQGIERAQIVFCLDLDPAWIKENVITIVSAMRQLMTAKSSVREVGVLYDRYRHRIHDNNTNKFEHILSALSTFPQSHQRPSLERIISYGIRLDWNTVRSDVQKIMIVWTDRRSWKWGDDVHDADDVKAIAENARASLQPYDPFTFILRILYLNNIILCIVPVNVSAVLVFEELRTIYPSVRIPPSDQPYSFLDTRFLDQLSS